MSDDWIDGETVASRLAHYVAGVRYEDLPSEVIAKARQVVLDTIGCMLAGSRDPVGARAAAYASRGGSGGPCTLFGSTASADPESAAFANGTSAHALEIDDGHRPSDDHIACVVVPATLSLAEATSAQERELLASVVAGYDAMGRAGEAILLPRQGGSFHGTGVAGVVGSAAAAARLLDLGPAITTHALGIAGDGASGLNEWRSGGTDVKPLHAGRAAQQGIQAAFLARSGLEGPPAIFEGEAGFCRAFSAEPRPELITAELGRRFAILESAFKIHASVGGCFTAIDGALWLRREHHIDPSRIERIRIAVPRWVRQSAGRKFDPPRSPGESRRSLPFVVALALLEGEVTHRHHTAATIAAPAVVALERRISFVDDAEVESIFETTRSDPRFHVPCAIEIDRAGTTVRRVETIPRGYDPRYPLSDADVVAKFRSVTGDLLTTGQADRAVEWVRALGTSSDGRSVPRIASLLTGVV